MSDDEDSLPLAPSDGDTTTLGGPHPPAPPFPSSSTRPKKTARISTAATATPINKKLHQKNAPPSTDPTPAFTEEELKCKDIEVKSDKKSKVGKYKVAVAIKDDAKSEYIRSPYKWFVSVVPLSTVPSSQQDEVGDELRRDFPDDYKLGIFDDKEKVEVVILNKRSVVYTTDEGDNTQQHDDEEVKIPPTVLVISFGRFKRGEDELTITHTRDGGVERKLKFTQASKLDMFWRDLTDAHNREVDRSKRTHSSVIVNTIGSMRSDLTKMKETVGGYQDLIDKALSNADTAMELSNKAKEAMNESSVKYQDTMFEMLKTIQLMQTDISNFLQNVDETSETKTLFGQRLDTLNCEVSKIPVAVSKMNGGVMFANGQELVDRLLAENANWLKYDGGNRKELKAKLEELRDLSNAKLNRKVNPLKGINKTNAQRGLKQIDMMIKYTDQDQDGNLLPDYLEKELVDNLEKSLKMKRKQVGTKVTKEGDTYINRSGFTAMSTLRYLGFDLLEDIREKINYHSEEDDDRIYDNGEKIWKCWSKNKDGDDGQECHSCSGRYVQRIVYGQFMELSQLIYQLTKFEWCEKQYKQWLADPVETLYRREEIEFCASIMYGFPCLLEISHLHHQSKCVNPQNLAVERNFINGRRSKHTAETCDCDSFGYLKCLALSKKEEED